MFYVYHHLRLDNNLPFYVGKGCKNRAFKKDRKNKGWNHIVNKVGFEVEILKYFENEDEALTYEHELIKIYQDQNIQLVNQTKYSEGGTKWSYTDEVKEKQRLGQIGTKRPKNKEWREKVSKANKGRKILWKDKISKSLKKFAPNRQHNPHAKTILQYDLKNNFIQEFPSAMEAGRALNKSGNSIADCASGRQKTAYGFTWKYKN
jgi:hypothetical protein